MQTTFQRSLTHTQGSIVRVQRGFKGPCCDHQSTALILSPNTTHTKPHTYTLSVSRSVCVCGTKQPPFCTPLGRSVFAKHRENDFSLCQTCGCYLRCCLLCVAGGGNSSSAAANAAPPPDEETAAAGANNNGSGEYTQRRRSLFMS